MNERRTDRNRARPGKEGMVGVPANGMGIISGNVATDEAATFGLLHRFVQGIEFPEAEAEIRKFVDDVPDLSDADVPGLMAAVFDRPAIPTPFHQE
ncbi:MAG: hypothetical protein ACYCZD_08655 [Rhodanobacter sp.]